ncbi:MAG TPA: matrixin family metalloprotease [Thermoanaerobaculia bacterium]|nr:matrixin family metalloprotease [Thermoanaerobaculia bacterium]
MESLALLLLLALPLPDPPAPPPPALCFAPGTPLADIEAVTFSGGDPGTSLDLPQPGLGLKYQLFTSPFDRWTSTATNGGGLSQGSPTTLTWSYVPDGTSIPSNPSLAGDATGPSNLFAWLNGLYGNFNTWHAFFVQVFDRWSQISGITYVYQPSDDGAAFPQSGVSSGASGALGVRGDVRISARTLGGPSGVLAFNFSPNSGDMVIDSADGYFNTTTNNSIRLRNTLGHEHGHGLGFTHSCPDDDTKLMEPAISTNFDGPQLDDLLAVQRQYGDPLENNDSSGAATILPGSSALVEGIALDDNGDVDFFRFSVGSATQVTARAIPTGATYLEGPQVGASCSAGTSFNTLTLNDLGVALLDTNGSTVLATSNVNPAGQAESVTFALPAAGDYYVRVFAGGLNTVQAYRLEVGDVIFADGFESGDTSAWSTVVP